MTNIKNLILSHKRIAIVVAVLVLTIGTTTVLALNLPGTTAKTPASSAVNSLSSLSAGNSVAEISATSSAVSSAPPSAPVSSVPVSNTPADSTAALNAPVNIAVSSVDFDFRSKTLNIGGTCQPKPTVRPSNVTDKSLKWTTSDDSVATVDGNGLVTAKAAGTAYIRATAPNGQRDTCTVTVKSNETASTGTTGGSTGNTGGTTGGNTGDGSTGGSTGGTTDTLHTKVPQSQENKTATINGSTVTLNVNAFVIQGIMSVGEAAKYVGDNIYETVTNDKGKILRHNAYCGSLMTQGQFTFSSTLDTYQYNGQYWLTPATYTVNVYCKQSEWSLIKTDRPETVQIATFKFSVYEQGFSN